MKDVLYLYTMKADGSVNIKLVCIYICVCVCLIPALCCALIYVRIVSRFGYF